MKKTRKRVGPKVRKATRARRFQSRSERVAAGHALRERVPRQSHADWIPSTSRRDPVDVIEESNRGRIPELTPIRYGRMVRSPFTFLRGSAGLMAYDLATTPTTGVRVQCCGDCHLLNFGLFATPERNLVFDLNDFDETLPAPWEWDLKRLTVSFAVAGRSNRFSDSDTAKVVVECARSYRERLREYSHMSPLDVWYERLDMESIIASAPDENARKVRERLAERARERVVENLFPKISGDIGDKRRLVDQPPVLYHVSTKGFEDAVREGMEDYRATLSDERRVLFDRYRLEDFALKVVGIGSVGTRCYVALLISEEDQPLLLQLKEARRSVLEPYTKKSRYDNQGERVVMGQRLMQSSSDIFLGWVRGRGGLDFYVRQLRDMKLSIPVEACSEIQLKRYAEFCGWTLARAHAKAGDAATISGYLGKSDAFDEAISSFAFGYADQTEHDHAVLVEAVNSGSVETIVEEE